MTPHLKSLVQAVQMKGHNIMLCFYAELINIIPTVKILKFGTPQTIAIIVLKLVKFDITLH